jgi:hypothetical protein
MNNTISLTPGFSPVPAGQADQNRFNGFSRADKPLKRLAHRATLNTRLKPGVNENRFVIAHFCGIQIEPLQSITFQPFNKQNYVQKNSRRL